MATKEKDMAKADKDRKDRIAKPSRVLNGKIEPGANLFEVLKNNIFFSANGSMKYIRKIAVTSRYSGEGVTTITSGLISVLARQDLGPVLYVDMNYLHPNGADAFNVKPTPGLGHMLKAGFAEPSCIQKSVIPNLDVVTANDLSSDPVDEPMLEPVISALQSYYNLIVFDLPSYEQSLKTVLGVGSLSDGVILVFESERVRREVAKRMKEQLASSGCKILGAVINKKRFYIPKFIYKTL